MRNTHTRLINYNGNCFYVEFEYYPREEATNFGPEADICKIYYCEVDVTEIMHHENIKEMEDLIVDEFAEDFYYLSKPC